MCTLTQPYESVFILYDCMGGGGGCMLAVALKKIDDSSCCLINWEFVFVWRL